MADVSLAVLLGFAVGLHLGTAIGMVWAMYDHRRLSRGLRDLVTSSREEVDK